MKFRTACQHQAGESTVKCLSQAHDRMARVGFKPGPCRSNSRHSNHSITLPTINDYFLKRNKNRTEGTPKSSPNFKFKFIFILFVASNKNTNKILIKTVRSAVLTQETEKTPHDYQIQCHLKFGDSLHSKIKQTIKSEDEQESKKKQKEAIA